MGNSISADEKSEARRAGRMAAEMHCKIEDLIYVLMQIKLLTSSVLLLATMLQLKDNRKIV